MTNNGNVYKADEGKWFVRKSDSFVMGESIDLGISDSIENYDEVEHSEEEYQAFCEKYGIKTKKDMEAEMNARREEMKRKHQQAKPEKEPSE